MPETINLTSRKTAPAKVLSSHYYDETTKEYTGKFSECYREAGHDFMKSFKVLRLAYLFTYHILSADDVFLYETLQLLCERGLPFTIERLADELGKGNTAIRQSLDNLENAELLEILKSDGQGKSNFYVLRTPIFERESIVGDSDAVLGRQNRIIKAGFDLPETFLEDNYKRLIKQVKENKARRLREIARNKELQKANPQLYNEFKENSNNRLLTWHKIVKKLGNTKAAHFDNIVFSLIQRLKNIDSMDFWRIFKERLKEYLAAAKISFDAFLLDYGVELASFYDQRRADRQEQPTRTPAAAPSSDVTEEITEGDELQTSLLRTILRDKAKQVHHWTRATISDFARICREYGANLTPLQLEAITADELPANVSKQIFDEMRS